MYVNIVIVGIDHDAGCDNVIPTEGLFLLTAERYLVLLERPYIIECIWLSKKLSHGLSSSFRLF